MATEQFPIVFDEDGLVFERLAKENGRRTWSARHLMGAPGYDKWPVFNKVIETAMSACALLGIDIFQHFSPSVTNTNGRNADDYSLSQSACCMIALNSDSKKENVAATQVYFLSIAEIVADQKLDHAESMDRLAIQEEISDREITLYRTAAKAAIESYALFTTAGYMGKYEMDYQALRTLRGASTLPKRSVLDFMRQDELAGNLFRLSLTEGRIKREQTRGPRGLEGVARQVKQRVRQTMKEEISLYPEQLPTAQVIRQVQKCAKKAGSDLGQIDDVDAGQKAEALHLDAALPKPRTDSVVGCAECVGGNLDPWRVAEITPIVYASSAADLLVGFVDASLTRISSFDIGGIERGGVVNRPALQRWVCDSYFNCGMLAVDNTNA